jgi:hypothetical protein
MRQDLQWGGQRSTGLVDVLDRVLDKGLVIAGDIKISLADVELLAIRIRLIVCSLDKAQEVGLDWWKYDKHLAPGGPLTAENEALREQVKALEHQVAELTANATVSRPLTGPPGAGGTVPSKAAEAVSRPKLAETDPRRRPRAELPAPPGGKPTGHE